MVTATSPGHFPIYFRPSNIGLGWGAYDNFHQWQANGRQIKKDMVKNENWPLTRNQPLTFDFGDPQEITVKPLLKSLEKDDDDDRLPPASLWKRMNGRPSKGGQRGGRGESGAGSARQAVQGFEWE